MSPLLLTRTFSWLFLLQFLADFQLSAGAGYARLESGFPSVEKSSNPKIILQATQNYITLMDSLKLNMCAVDTLQPILSDLVESVRNVHLLCLLCVTAGSSYGLLLRGLTGFVCLCVCVCVTAAQVSSGIQL